MQAMQPVKAEVPRQQGKQPHQHRWPTAQQIQAEVRRHIAVTGDFQPAEQPQHDMAGVEIEHQIVPVDLLALCILQHQRLTNHHKQHEQDRHRQFAHPISPLVALRRQLCLR
ncbi:hypothetical protein D3C75_1088520 [compost metagenome]